MSSNPDILASSSRAPALAFASLAAAWLALLVAAPWAVMHVPSRNPVSEAGALVYLAGGFLCHQRPDRSFHAWGLQLPVCARCFGLYAGALLGSGLKLAHLSVWPPVPHGTKRALSDLTPTGLTVRFALAPLPTLLSVGIEAAGLWAQTPVVRCIAALPLGFAVAWCVADHAADVAGQWRTRRGV